MKKLMVMTMLALFIIGGITSSSSNLNTTAYAYPCRYSPDGWIDWSGRDRDYLCAGHGYYYRFYTHCVTRYIISLEVPWGADFDLYLVRDTSWPWGRLDGDDTVVCRSDKSGSSDEYINCDTYYDDYYFVVVWGYSGCGWYDLSIKLDW